MSYHLRFIFALVLISCLAVASAHASEKVEDIGLSSPAQVDEYSRQGSKINLTFTGPDEGNASVVISCGDPTGGQWVGGSVTGLCYSSKFCYDVPTDQVDAIIAAHLAGKTILSRDVVAGTEGKVTNLCYKFDRVATLDDVVIDPYSKCVGGAIKKVAGAGGGDVKRHCVFNYQGPSGGIIGDDNDDMFRLKGSVSSFLEYVDRSAGLNNKRLRWLEGNTGSEPVMLPSGPHASGPDQYKDFDIFMRRGPGGISSEDACYPVKVSLCAGITKPPESPPTPGLCGSADGQSYSQASDIPASALCYIGPATTVSEDADGFTWSCKGIPDTEAADNCHADRIADDITRRPPPCDPNVVGSKKLDVLFLADNTGSMGPVIEAVQKKAHSILAQMSGDNPHYHPLDVRWAVASYQGDPVEQNMDEFPYRQMQKITSDKKATSDAFDKWVAAGGGDLPEGQMYAFSKLVSDTGWRDDAHHFMIWMGDAPGHTETVSLDQAISALKSKYIYTMALSSSSFAGSSIDTDGQATAIINETGGLLADISSISDQKLADLIVDEVYRGFTQTCQ